MKLDMILTGLFVGIILLSGCVTVNLGNENTAGTTSPTSSQIIKTTISTITTTNQVTWTQIVDNTYVLTGTCKLNEVVIPVNPNSAYRLNVNGQKRLVITIYEDKGPECDSQGNAIGYSSSDEIIIARSVTNYNGIFKTSPHQKNLMIKWLYLANAANEPYVVGSSQTVNVKLERYNGDSNIFPKTTDVDSGIARTY
jgi:hypothetical protein